MKDLPADTVLEFEHRESFATDMLESSYDALDKGKVIPKRKSFSYNFMAGTYLGRSIIYQLLKKTELANSDIQKILPLFKKAMYDESALDNDYHQYYFFTLCLFTADNNQINESAKAILKSGVSKSRFLAPSELYLVLASLWLEKKDLSEQLLPNIKRFEEQKKEKFVKPGYFLALKGILNKDISQAANGINELLEAHKHEAKYLKTALIGSNLVCFQATELCIIALKYGMDLKSEVNNSTAILKTKMFSPLDRPDIPEKTKFEVPVDLIPEWIINPWREIFKNR